LPDGFYGHLHNIYTQYSAERGIPAMLAMVGFLLWNLGLWVRVLMRLPRDGVSRLQDSAWLLRAGVAMIMAILINGLFDHDLGASAILAMTLGGVAAIDTAYREIVNV
jgi:O-antigen ligase